MMEIQDGGFSERLHNFRIILHDKINRSASSRNKVLQVLFIVMSKNERSPFSMLGENTLNSFQFFYKSFEFCATLYFNVNFR